MSERVLWLRLCVTGPIPECGEIVGLRIVDRQAHRTVFDAFFHPVREDGWKSVPAGGMNVNLANRLPLSIYVEGIERILSGATLLRGEHVARDIRFLRAVGVHIKDKVVERSVTAEQHRRLASGIAVPTRAGKFAVKRENRECQPYKRVRPTAAKADRRSSAIAEATSWTNPYASSQIVAASTQPDMTPGSCSSPSVTPTDHLVLTISVPSIHAAHG